MRLYAGPSNRFITVSVQNKITAKLKTAFFDCYRNNPPPSEVHRGRAV